ncbi:hypothetical protein GCM10023347_25240 [Streptomyces chumphonensis]|uniref:DUF397 domain-containing protein n=1 Tax=Streptomyces chumphonensis TaxID=1214925 RepID=A0A927IAZ5_9ACTN|nr:DUF397 domain-containing protein [Streptomyces chumphonensis]MBD3929984.1 DUF397 domain-containing protein [Streptomyces chumphonensis]
MRTNDEAWVKSSYSSAQGDDCVEVLVSGPAVHVRDSKDVTRPHVGASPAAWVSLVGFVGGR